MASTSTSSAYDPRCALLELVAGPFRAELSGGHGGGDGRGESQGTVTGNGGEDDRREKPEFRVQKNGKGGRRKAAGETPALPVNGDGGTATGASWKLAVQGRLGAGVWIYIGWKPMPHGGWE